MPKKIFIILVAILLIVFGLLTFNFKKQKKIEASPSPSGNVWGWAWAGYPTSTPLEAGSGWISFNSTNTGATIDYGVDINPSTFKFSGRAWSGGGEEAGSPRRVLGWLSFERAETGAPPSDDPCPDGSCIARVDNVSSTICDTDSNNYLDQRCGGANDSTTPVVNYRQVFGWARFCGIPDGGASLVCGGDGWDGWIKFSHNSQIIDRKYGTTIDITTSSKQFLGWAWGSDVIGWISFNTSNYPGGSDYKVVTSLFSPPTASNLQESISYCNFFAGQGRFDLSWTYTDPENTNQWAYSLEVQQFNAVSNVWEQKVLCENVTTTGPASGGTGTSLIRIKLTPTADLCDLPNYVGDIEYGKSTRWRVQVKDSDGVWSGWTSWTTPTTTVSHAYPWPDFAPLPSQPSFDEVVTFEQDGPPPTGAPETLCYSGAVPLCQDDPNASYQWDFDQNVNPGFDSTYEGNATTTYANAGSYTVVLRITDATLPAPNNYCETSRTLSVSLPLPEWKEIPPR